MRRKIPAVDLNRFAQHALIEAAREQRRAEEAMLSVVPIGAHSAGHARLMTEWIDAGCKLDEVLAKVGAPGSYPPAGLPESGEETES